MTADLLSHDDGPVEETLPVDLAVPDPIPEEGINAAVDLMRATSGDEAAAWGLFCRRGDKDYSYTDCVSFVMMRRLGIARAAACDDDFRREGFDVVP